MPYTVNLVKVGLRHFRMSEAQNFSFVLGGITIRTAEPKFTIPNKISIANRNFDNLKCHILVKSNYVELW